MSLWGNPPALKLEIQSGTILREYCSLSSAVGQNICNIGAVFLTIFKQGTVTVLREISATYTVKNLS